MQKQPLYLIQQTNNQQHFTFRRSLITIKITSSNICKVTDCKERVRMHYVNSLTIVVNELHQNTKKVLGFKIMTDASDYFNGVDFSQEITTDVSDYGTGAVLNQDNFHIKMYIYTFGYKF